MVAPWLNALALASLAIALACAAYILVDVVRRPQRMAIMNWVWPITALYAGPLAVGVHRLEQSVGETARRGRYGECDALRRRLLARRHHRGIGHPFAHGI